MGHIKQVIHAQLMGCYDKLPRMGERVSTEGLVVSCDSVVLRSRLF